MTISAVRDARTLVDRSRLLPTVVRVLADRGRAAVPDVLVLAGDVLGAALTLQEPPSAVEPGLPSQRRGPFSLDLPVTAGGRLVAILEVELDPSGPIRPSTPHGPAGAVDAHRRGHGVRPEDRDALVGVADAVGLVLGGPPAPSAVTAAMLEVEEETRGELAHQLHDSLVQSLIAARYLADLACRTGGTTAVSDAVQAALVDSRHLLARLRPRALDGRGLEQALRSLLPEDGGDRVVVEASVPAALPPVVGACAYRFTQAVVGDLLARGLEPARICTHVEEGRLAVVVDVVPGGPASAGYPWAARGHRPDPPTSALALSRWTRRLRLLGAEVHVDESSAHAWLPLSDGAVRRPEGGLVPGSRSRSTDQTHQMDQIHQGAHRSHDTLGRRDRGES